MFMFVWVPLPVCQTLSGNWLSCWPLAMVSAASAIALARAVENLHLGVDHGTGLFDPGQGMDQLAGIRSSLIAKFLRERWVWAPQSASAGTRRPQAVLLLSNPNINRRMPPQTLNRMQPG